MHFECALRLLVLNVCIFGLCCSPVRKRNGKLSMQTMSGFGKRAPPHLASATMLDDMLEQALMSFDSEYVNEMRPQDPANGEARLRDDILEQKTPTHGKSPVPDLERLVFWLERKYGLNHHGPSSIDDWRGQQEPQRKVVGDIEDQGQFLELSDVVLNDGQGYASNTWLGMYGEE